MDVISACSWPSYRSFLFKNFYSSLMIDHPRPGCRHVIKPCVEMRLILFARSSHISNEFNPINTTIPVAGIFLSLVAFVACEGSEDRSDVSQNHVDPFEVSSSH